MLALVGLAVMVPPRALAQAESTLAIAVGEPGSPSYRVGLGLSAVLEQAALPDGTRMRPELWESLSPEERIEVLSEEAQIAVIPAGDPELETARARELARAAAGFADGSQILVRADLGDDLVYDLTQLMFERADLIRSAYPEAGELEPGASFERLAGAAHPGALRYYEEQKAVAALPADQPAATADATETPLPEGRSFTVYFDFDEAEFDLKQIGVVQEACGFAATLPAAEFVLSGHADTVGPEPYNDQLSLARAQSVASMIRNDPRFRDALNVIRFGESMPAVETGDEVAAPENRRVVITVVPGAAARATLEALKAAGGAAPEQP